MLSTGLAYGAFQDGDGPVEMVGIVRNLADGRVEIEAEGTVDELKEFLQAVRESGLGPMIRGEAEFWSEPVGGFRGFEIVR